MESTTEHIELIKGLEQLSFLDKAFRLPFLLGRDVDSDRLVSDDYLNVPHIAIAGATGMGKSTLAHAMLLSVMRNASPKKLKIVLCDTKMIEYCCYNNSPFLLLPVISTEAKIYGIIQWAKTELGRRLKIFAEGQNRSIRTHNDQAWEQYRDELPHILLVIDDAAVIAEDDDSMQAVRYIAKNGRSAGIHLLLITQTPSVKGLADIIKHYIPGRIIFDVLSKNDIRLMIDTYSLNKCGGIGSCVYYRADTKAQRNVHAFPVSDAAIDIVLTALAEQWEDIPDKPIEDHQGKKIQYEDDMLPAAMDVILEAEQASVSVIQRRLRLGYARSARIIDEMDEMGLIGPFNGAHPRTILVSKEYWCELKMHLVRRE